MGGLEKPRPLALTFQTHAENLGKIEKEIERIHYNHGMGTKDDTVGKKVADSINGLTQARVALHEAAGLRALEELRALNPHHEDYE